MHNFRSTLAVWFSRGASLIVAFALVLSVQLLFAQQTDPNATPAPEQPKVSYLAYFLSILAIVLGLVVMLRPGSRVDPDAK